MKRPQTNRLAAAAIALVALMMALRPRVPRPPTRQRPPRYCWCCRAMIPWDEKAGTIIRNKERVWKCMICEHDGFAEWGC